MKICGKIVVITGASSGIGLALARACSQRGAKVVLAARSIEKLRTIEEELPTDSLAVECDVSRQQECKRLIELCVDRFGGVDILINNAGVSMRALFDEVDLEVLHRSMNTNFWGAVYCTKYALPYIQSSGGSVVGVSSVAGIHGLPCRTGYSASKYAMQGFLDTLRSENMYKGVHVMVACPGFTESNVRFAAMTSDGSPQGESPRKEERMMSAEEVAERIIRGIEKRKRTLLMDFNGRASWVLKFIAPRFLDKMYYRVMANEPDSPLKR
ncbi:short chain dehydrogenase [Mucinivorans hirudinis]|uniref:Short chain dehydrogenase n=1 Tax=Mucinivorans hirudinis TaxID=1433126 RepID=A0A060RBF3_9BACT|nr:short chain dehydrogenase [Mucinivorans hirudinis]